MQFLLENMIAAFRKRRKNAYLDKPAGYEKHYAFIGAGSHSIANLYPCIQYLGVPIRMVNTRTADSANKMAKRFQECQATTDINMIIENKSISGVFVSVKPEQHFSIVKKLLENGKSVFVEKPPCLDLQELEQLMQIRNEGICVVGLQKRFSVVNRYLSRKVKNLLTYHYRYLTGQYPEGDPLKELFIHPLDNIVQLFGPVAATKVSANTERNDFHLLVTHENGARGMVEMSTLYSWSSPVDQLEVNTSREILKASYPYSLTAYRKPAVIMGVPLDKAFPRGATETSYVYNNGFVPTAENNSLYMQGYLGEIEHFVNLVEGKEKVNRCSLESLVGTYNLIERVMRYEV